MNTTKTTQIFTGHNIVLTDLRAISGVMRMIKTGQPYYTHTLYIEINLCDGVIIRHEGIKVNTFYEEWEPAQKERWDQAFSALEAQRQELVQQWEQALNPVAHAGNV